jgi:hypothetical protein
MVPGTLCVVLFSPATRFIDRITAQESKCLVTSAINMLMTPKALYVASRVDMSSLLDV